MEEETPRTDGALKKEDRKKILHCRQLYADLPDPIVFMSRGIRSVSFPSRFWLQSNQQNPHFK
jgi:hypothetical protein